MKYPAYFTAASMLLISGCASDPGTLRAYSSMSTPVANLPSQGSTAITVHKVRGIKLYEVCIQSVKEKNAISAVCKESILYERLADTNDVTNPMNNETNTISAAFDNCNDLIECKNDRNKFIDLAVRIADNNCNEFRERIFTDRASANIATNFVKDLMSAGGAATAFSAPSTSAGMSVSSILTGSYEKSSQELFSNKTSQVFDRAIEQSMKAFYDDSIVANCKDSSYSKCSIQKSVDLLKKYTNLCGVRSALLTIENALKTENISKEEIKRAATDAADQAAKKATENNLETVVAKTIDGQLKGIKDSVISTGETVKSIKSGIEQSQADISNVKDRLCRVLSESSDQSFNSAFTGYCP